MQDIDIFEVFVSLCEGSIWPFTWVNDVGAAAKLTP
jgi:hypothetical protein